MFLDFQGDKLNQVSINGAVVPQPSIENHRIYLPTNKLKSGKNRIEVQYENQFDTNGRGLHRFVDSVDGNEYFFSHFEPFNANRVFPSFDQPDLKAHFSLTVDAPTEWKIISNTMAKITKQGKQARHQFTRSKPFSTYLFALLGGPYAEFKDTKTNAIPFRVFSTRSMAAHVDAENIFSVTRQGFAFFETYFGIPYPFGKYDQIFVPHFNEGAMENVAAVVVNDNYLYREPPTNTKLLKRANTILHEMAHMWFGDIVTMSWWNDLWLNESFATYMSYLAQAETQSDPDAWTHFAFSMKEWAYWQDQLPTTHPIETQVIDTQSTFDNFDGITYGKGAAVLKQLAYFVGKDAFRQGVSAYLHQYAWHNAKREDFTNAIENASGTNLNAWTRLWLEKSGVNSIRVKYGTDEAGKISDFFLQQDPGNGDAVLRPHRLKLALYYFKDGKLIQGKTISTMIDTAKVNIPGFKGQMAPDFVYANDDDQAYAKFYLDRRSLEFARKHLEILPGQLRVAVWNSLWFMVEDGELSAVSYMDIFLNKASLETDAKLLHSLRWNLYALLKKFLRPQDWNRAMRRLHHIAWKELQTLPEGSDLGDIWFNYLLHSAVFHEMQPKLLGMLSGSIVLPAVKISQDKRWELIVGLAALGYKNTEVLIQHEQQQDPGERGSRYALMAMAAMPDTKMKNKIWQMLLTDKTLPLTHVRAALAGC